MNDYVAVIGLEVHAELTTESKLFCRCKNTSSELQTPPNSAICPVCLGLPGALPVINKRAVEATVTLGRSVGAKIPEVTKWDRKNYFYPDLPKGYQISQYDMPLCQGGEISWYDRTGTQHSVELTRIHLEEDTGKLTHPAGTNYSLIDYNRSSIPLLELVTEPVIASAEEAKQFCEEYQMRLRELGVAEASMEKGQMRCEANISVVPAALATDPKQRLSGTKVEVKNLNSFRSLERAIRCEIERQSQVLRDGGTVTQETRGWNEGKGETYSMRTKETADDYRYFPEPDLGVLSLDWIAESPLSETSRAEEFANYLALGAKPEDIFTVINDPARRAFIHTVEASDLTPTVRGLLLQWVAQEPQLMHFMAAEVRNALGQLAEQVISAHALKSALSTAQPGTLNETLSQFQATHASIDVAGIVATVLSENSTEVDRYKAGDTKLFGFFVGKVRQKLEGSGDPAAIAAELKKQLD